MPDKTFSILYSFRFEDGRTKEFTIELDAQTLNLVRRNEPSPREWTRLQYAKCENCQLSPDHEHCPVALNLVEVIEFFSDAHSFEPAQVSVATEERGYTKKTTVQKGLSSMMGIMMPASGCPTLDKLRPMVRFHLPFSSPLETFYRSISMYLTAQFFRMKAEKSADWSLDDHLHVYKDVALVNRGIANRLTVASKADANLNAIVILHSIGDGIQYFIETELEELRNLFKAYVEE
ncbi:MAG: hypothetical protein HY966_03350 [Ignavibacteriales bacterium]|nr:hypothetical protein [Ignavibacteriales bacterium]